jgi:hypothetical protein
LWLSTDANFYGLPIRLVVAAHATPFELKSNDLRFANRIPQSIHNPGTLKHKIPAAPESAAPISSASAEVRAASVVAIDLFVNRD